MSPNADKPYYKSFLDEYSVIDNKLALMTTTSIIDTGLFILTIRVDIYSSAFAKKYNTQTVEQIDSCGPLINNECNLF
jgi:hypothetical protein